MIPTHREGPSPFLSETAIQFAWDSTCLGAFKKCPRYYQLSILEGWRPKASRIDLEFGSYYTEALESYALLRAQDLSHEDALLQVTQEVLYATWVVDKNTIDEVEEEATSFRWQHGLHNSNHNNKNFYNLLRTVIWYLDIFEHDPAETVITKDGTPLVERSFRMELDWEPLDPQGEWRSDASKPKPGPYLLCGHLDRVVSFTGGVYAMDHKTTKSTISDYYFDQYSPNNQMSLYTIAAKVIFDTPIKGVIIDAAQVAVGFSRFARGLTYRTEAQSEEWLGDLRYWLTQAESCAIADYWPMNDTACFNCDFNKGDGKICSKDPVVRASFLRSHFTQEDPWNPLKPRN